jgi:hypothetical protein
MHKTEFVAIGVRLFAIALAIYSLKNFPGMYMYFDAQHDQSSANLYAGLFLFMLLLAILLWHFPLSVASKITPKTASNETSISWSEKDLLTVGLILIGVYLFYHVISDSIYWLYVLNVSHTYTGMEIELNSDQKASIYSTAVEFFLSLSLIIGAKGISNVIWYLRHAGK